MTRLPMGASPSKPSHGRSILFGLLAVLSVGALGVLPAACQSGGVGDPCTPEDEYRSDFGGFKVELENIESRSFQCQTRICLVNHFQGRVSCPQGQPPPKACNPVNKGSECSAGAACVESQVFAPACNHCDGSDPTCTEIPCPDPAIQQCDMTRGGICTCSTSNTGTYNGVAVFCEPFSSDPNSPLVLRSYVCHKANNCQTVADGITTANQGKDCCIPGTDSPVAASVCGQCDSASKRNADLSVYCSCRCCVPCCAAGTTPSDSNPCSTDISICGTACDPNFNYCSCPSGFTCTGIRSDVGLGDKQLAGAYCIKQQTAFEAANPNCGNVVGYTGDQSCKGMGTTASASGDGG